MTKIFFALTLFLPLFFASGMRVEAIAPPISGSYVSLVDASGDCGQTQSVGNEAGIVLKANVTATGVDSENGLAIDIFQVNVRDGNGQQIGRSTISVAVGGQQPLNPVAVLINPSPNAGPGYSVGLIAPTARPWTVFVQDVIMATNSLGSQIELFTFDPLQYSASCGSLPFVTPQISHALNSGVNDLNVQMFNGTDDNGEPALHIYDINAEGEGTLALTITQDIIAPYIDNPPSENTELLTSEDGKVTLYILDTGELQINSGPDAEGKIHVLIFDGIPPTNIYGYVIDPPIAG